MKHALTQKALLLTGLLLTLFLSSCGGPFAEAEYDFENDCWSQRDSVILTFDNEDTTRIFRLYYPVLLTEDYSYNNIYLQSMVVSPSGDQNVLPARFDLSDPAGNWYSEPSGEEIPFKLTVADGFQFNQLGTYTVKLFHYMRDEPLCGVREAGVALAELE